jgi:hypothetical protein
MSFKSISNLRKTSSPSHHLITFGSRSIVDASSLLKTFVINSDLQDLNKSWYAALISQDTE